MSDEIPKESNLDNVEIRAALEAMVSEVQIQMDTQYAIDEAVRNIREDALRQVMVMVNKLPLPSAAFRANYHVDFGVGWQQARMQLYDEIEAMIATPVGDK